MTKRDCQSGNGAAFQAVKGGFDSRVPLQFHGIEIIPDRRLQPGEIEFWVFPGGVAYTMGDNVPWSK